MPNEQAAEIRETYLAQISSRLQGGMSPLETYETTQELRAHLDALALAYVEMGLDTTDAMSAAIQKFGSAPHVAKGLSETKAVSNLTFSLPVAMLLSIAIVGFAGAALVSGYGWLVFALGRTAKADLAAGFAFGLGAGSVIGFLGYLFRGRALAFVIGLCVLVNVALIPLYSTLVSIGRVPDLWIFSVGNNLELIVLSAFSVFCSRRFAATLDAGAPTPPRSGALPVSLILNVLATGCLGTVALAVVNAVLFSLMRGAALTGSLIDQAITPMAFGCSALVGLAGWAFKGKPSQLAWIVSGLVILVCMPLLAGYIGGGRYGDAAFSSAGITATFYWLSLMSTRLARRIKEREDAKRGPLVG